MQKAPTRGHRALSNKRSQPNYIIACKIHREENERKTYLALVRNWAILTKMTVYCRLQIQVLVQDLQSLSDLAYFMGFK